MEESQKLIQIHSNISPQLLLNVQNRPNKKQYAYKSYFSVVQKFRQKEKQLSEAKKKKNGFVDKFYEKLKRQLQNNSDSKKLKENLSLMNICLKHKHARHASENLKTMDRKRTDFTKRPQYSKRQTSREENFFQSQMLESRYYTTKTRSIINFCQKQNQELNYIHKKMNLFNYYSKKMDQKFTESHRKIKKTVRQF